MDTTEATTVSAEPSKNDVVTEGTQTQSVQTEAPKTFTQADVDKIVQSRLVEKERTMKSKFEKDLEAQLNTTREEALKDLDKLVDERVNAREAEKALADAHTAIQAQYELTEEQAARLQGSTPDELQADAATIFGTMKRLPTPPTLKTGANSGPASPVDINEMTPAQIREQRDSLWKTNVRPI